MTIIHDGDVVDVCETVGGVSIDFVESGVLSVRVEIFICFSDSNEFV
jgi:hypothetical protein